VCVKGHTTTKELNIYMKWHYGATNLTLEVPALISKVPSETTVKQQYLSFPQRSF
jgi:hypothetical protein